jgi:hypothetical protein
VLSLSPNCLENLSAGHEKEKRKREKKKKKKKRAADQQMTFFHATHLYSFFFPITYVRGGIFTSLSFPAPFFFSSG